MLIDRILIVGLGSIGQRHLDIARKKFPDARIKVLRHSPAKTVPANSDGNFFSIKDGVKFKPQIAVIANPSVFHVETAIALVGVGAHLLIEKPISSSLEGIPELLNICNARNLVIQVGYNLRFLESLQLFRDELKNNIIGRVLSVRCEAGQYLPSWRKNKDYTSSVSASKDLGGGVLLELSHEIDYLRWIFGEVEWVKATLCHQSNLDIDVEDTAYLVLGFNSKEGNKQLIGTLNLDFIRHDTTRSCVAIGEKGTLQWDSLTGQVRLYRPDSNNWVELYNNKEEIKKSYYIEWKAFIESIAQGKKPLIEIEDGIKVLQIVDAARISSESDQRVTITEESALYESNS